MPDHCRVFKKAIVDGCLYEAHKNKKQRSNNSFAMLKNETFIKIVCFVLNEKDGSELLLCNKINTKDMNYNYKPFKEIEYISSELTTVSTNKIEKICCFIKTKKMYICPFPNMLHY